MCEYLYLSRLPVQESVIKIIKKSQNKSPHPNLSYPSIAIEARSERYEPNHFPSKELSQLLTKQQSLTLAGATAADGLVAGVVATLNNGNPSASRRMGGSTGDVEDTDTSLGLAVTGEFEGVNWNLRALAERKEPIVVVPQPC